MRPEEVGILLPGPFALPLRAALYKLLDMLPRQEKHLLNLGAGLVDVTRACYEAHKTAVTPIYFSKFLGTYVRRALVDMCSWPNSPIAASLEERKRVVALIHLLDEERDTPAVDRVAVMAFAL